MGYAEHTTKDISLAPACEPSNEMETFLERLRGLDKDAALIADRLERMIARAFGEGSPSEHKAAAPVVAGSVGAIHSLLTSTSTSMVAASEAITRLDKLA